MIDFARRMAGKVRRFLTSKDKSTYVAKFLRRRRIIGHPGAPLTYSDRLKAENSRFTDVLDVNELPAIFHYWSNEHLRPIVAEFGVNHPDEWFANHFAEAAKDSVASPRFISIGSGNCDTEVRVAKLMRARGMQDFTIECLDINKAMLGRGKMLAEQEEVAQHLAFVRSDFNEWEPVGEYDGVMANQSLHHVIELETLFDKIAAALRPSGLFVVSDIIGRNGHQRWPEALDALRIFWRELPPSYRYNQMLRRHEELYESWDCSQEGFEGIRAQDILPLLLQRFQFYKFIGFGNIIDPFIDRAFGHNFDAKASWDRDFIDRVHAYEERAFREGELKPTHMFAVMTISEPPSRHYSRELSPEFSVRDPELAGGIDWKTKSIG